MEEKGKDTVSKSWFCIFDNPRKHGFSGTEQEICDAIADIWMQDNPQRTCAVLYCVSADGLEHCHAVFEDTKAMRFSMVKKLFPSMHIEPTKGNKDQAEDYINKRGQWEEKGEKILAKIQHGEIKGAQGQRRDIEIVEEMLENGYTPDWIMDKNLAFRRYEKMIRDAYYRKRFKETPPKRKINVTWHVGASGSGKSYEYVRIQNAEELCDAVYYVTDYEHGFDKYCGQSILFMDEFRGQMPYSRFLTLLDGYKTQVPCRYSNVYALWNYVVIATILPPEMVYTNMVDKYQDVDTYQQLKRRIETIVYHWVDDDGKYRKYEMPMVEYVDYDALKDKAEGSLKGEQMDLPF